MITFEAESELLEFIVISFGVTIGGKVFQIVVTKTVKSVQSLNKFHDTRDVIVSANASGKVHVWR